MDRIYDYKSGKLKEVSLTPGEQLMLLKENNKRVREQLSPATQAGLGGTTSVQIKARGDCCEEAGEGVGLRSCSGGVCSGEDVPS